MSKKLFEIQTVKIENGSKLMYKNTALTSWAGDLNSLNYGNYMFMGCTALSSFTGDLDSLTGGYFMFSSCSSLPEFSSNLQNLVNGQHMFYECTSLTSFTGDLSKMRVGPGMFCNCNKLTTLQRNQSGDPLEFTSLYNGYYMFRYCSSLESFNADLPALQGAPYMFANCEKMKTFTSPLNELLNCDGMFQGCTSLESFTINMPKLQNSYYMFNGCTSLSNFSSSLPELTSARCTFYNCTALSSFSSALPNLTDGDGMFYGCKLDAPSVKNIALTINRTVTNNPKIHLGINSSIASNTQVKKDIGLIKHKGWDVYTNNSNATTTYTLPKYAGCTNKSSIAAKDSNYKTNDIVNGVWVEHLPDLTDANSLFSSCTELKTFNSDISKLGGGAFMFYNSGLESFTSDLTSLKQGSGMFNSTKLTSFNIKMPNLTSGSNFFAHCYNLKTFSSNLNNMAVGLAMFNNATALTTFEADLPSLTNGNKMFYACKLNTASVQRIANKIKNVNGLTNTGQYDTIYKQIDIGIGNSTPNTQEKAAFNTIASRGWTVLVNGSAYSPTSVSSIMTLDEDGNEVETPIPFYAKPLPSDEETASYIDNDGNYYNILGAQFIYGDDLSTYGMFTCEEDAALNMRLTKIEK